MSLCSLAFGTQSLRRTLGAVALVVGCLSAASVHAVTIDMVTVGDPGNVADDTGFGAVNYEYRIGKYEVTIGQYAEFLNAVAKNDPGCQADPSNPGQWLSGSFQLLPPSSPNINGISRTGSPGSFQYSPYLPTLPQVWGSYRDGANSPSERPVTLDWFQAARFVNWMNNGQPTGDPGVSTTEDGLYPLFGAVSGAPGGSAQPHDLPTRAVNPNTGASPIYRIPTENEWYKAAYYKGGGTDSGYWDYATQSDAPPGISIGSDTNQANYHQRGFNSNGYYFSNGNAAWHSFNLEPSSVPGSLLTNVGVFTGSPSRYGTFDQSGNVREITDGTGIDMYGRPAGAGVQSVARGGDYDDHFSQLASSSRETSLYGVVGGFRLASFVAVGVPEIDPAGMGSVLALVTGALGLLERRRLKAA